jgi:hypothetical protein
MSANFVLDLQIEGEVQPFDELIKLDGSDNGKFMASFWPALHGNAIIDRKIFAVPFQNSTPSSTKSSAARSTTTRRPCSARSPSGTTSSPSTR